MVKPDISDGRNIVIKVIGVGGGGCNAINRMINDNLKGVEFIAVNTDLQALTVSKAPITVQIGEKITKGLGAGADPEVGQKAALEDQGQLQKYIMGAHMVFITAGMGGGTGTGAAPVIAKLSKEAGILTVGVVTKPFAFEGKDRMRQAEEGIKELRKYVDTLIIIPNQNLMRISSKNMSIYESFRKADEVLLRAVEGISDLITNTGIINVDFADVKTVMSERGDALMSVGYGKGDDKATKAIEEALNNPLLEDFSIEGAKAVLVNVNGGSDISIAEYDEIVSRITSSADENAKIISGLTYNPNMSDEVKVTVIATGIRHNSDNLEEERKESTATDFDSILKEIENNSNNRNDSLDIPGNEPEHIKIIPKIKHTYPLDDLEIPAFLRRIPHNN